MSNNVTLIINNLAYSGWKSVRVEAGVERVARSFELSVTDRWPGNVDHDQRVKPGDLCEIRIGDDLVCTGYVDATPIDYDASGITIMVRGRSKTADLVDCSADNATGQLKGLTAGGAARVLAKQYGIEVVEQVAVGDAITDHQIQQGESAFESLDRIAKARQILMTDDEQGRLVLAASGSGGHASSGLALGVNILSASAGFDFSEVYTNYQVKGQKSGTDDSFGAKASQLLGTASDSTLTRQRVLIVRQSGQADGKTCQERATYEAQIRAAKANEIRYRVAGWRQADGSLWAANTLVDIDDVVMRVKAARLISEVIYTLDDAGELCELVTIPPNAFDTMTETQAKLTTKKGKKSKKSKVTIDWGDE